MRRLCHDACLQGPADKCLPVDQHFIEAGGEVFSGGIAEVERQMASDEFGDRIHDRSTPMELSRMSSKRILLPNRLDSKEEIRQLFPLPLRPGLLRCNLPDQWAGGCSVTAR
jgi:hypothetical protein